MAVREASPNVGHHHAAADVDPLDRLVVDQERNSARAAGAFAAADARPVPVQTLGGVSIACVEPERAPIVSRRQCEAGAVRKRRLQDAIDVISLRRTAAIARECNGILGPVDDAIEREMAEARANLSLILTV